MRAMFWADPFPHFSYPLAGGFGAYCRFNISFCSSAALSPRHPTRSCWCWLVEMPSLYHRLRLASSRSYTHDARDSSAGRDMFSSSPSVSFWLFILTKIPGLDHSKALPASTARFFFLFLLVRSQVEDPQWQPALLPGPDADLGAACGCRAVAKGAESGPLIWAGNSGTPLPKDTHFSAILRRRHLTANDLGS